MLLFAGLGNPGPEYARTRHNLGFAVVDSIHRRHAGSSWRSPFPNSQVTDFRLGDQLVVLLKPTTYMNGSGLAIRDAIHYLKLGLDSLLVVHDEIERWPGTVHIKADGGNAGHNGLRSISEFCGNDYFRLQIGVGRPPPFLSVESYLLSNFAPEEMYWVDAVCAVIADSFELLAARRSEEFLHRVRSELAQRGIDQRTGRPPKK
jgi:PTH1 family peptidyl-tRNA hydrolase